MSKNDKYTILGLISLFCIIIAALPYAVPKEQHTDLVDSTRNSLVYFKDFSTGLCFAGYELGKSYGMMSNVPCTPEVENRIAKHLTEARNE